MRYEYTSSLLLLFTACQVTLQIPETPPCKYTVCSTDSQIQGDIPLGRCEDGVCETENGRLIPGQYLKDFIGPNATIFSAIEYMQGPDLARIGDILILIPSLKPMLPSAFLAGMMYKSKGNFANGPRFLRNIRDIRSGSSIGFVVVERPIPDPDTRFENLSSDSMLAAIPNGLRPWVDPASLVPSSTKGCATSKCIAIIPVSIRQIRSK